VRVLLATDVAAFALVRAAKLDPRLAGFVVPHLASEQLQSRRSLRCALMGRTSSAGSADVMLSRGGSASGATPGAAPCYARCADRGSLRR